MRSVSLIITLCLFSLHLTYAQTIAEGLRYSDVNYGSTARALGIGGSFSGLGPDISAASSNPAGLADFRKSEIMLSGFFNSGALETTFNGDKTSRSSAPFNLQSAGISFASSPIASNWTSVNFTVGLNKVATFDEEFSYTSTTPGSIVERFEERANGIGIDDLDNFEAWPAYSTGAIYDFNEDFIYESDFIDYTEQVYKSQLVKTSGGISEIVASIAGSRGKKLNLGLTIGVPFLSLTSDKSYIEEDFDNNVEVFDNLEYNEYTVTTGVGFNAKLGLLYKLTPKIRIGGAIHSPTTFFMTDDFYTELSYAFTEPNNPPQSNSYRNTEDGNYKYRVSTPWKALISGAYMLSFDKLKGFITAEAEYIDYSAMKFNLTAFTDFQDAVLEQDLKTQVANEFKSGVNIRIGSELVFNKYRIRGGVGLISPAYADGNPIGDLSNTINLGLGYRANRFYIDAAVEQKNRSERYSPYFLVDSGNNQVIDVKKTLRRLVVTAGYKI